MSDYHALERTEGRLTLVFHFRVPDVTNAVGVPVRQIVASESKPSSLPNISSQESAALAAGLLIEVNRQISIRDKDDQEIQRSIERVYDRARKELLGKLSRRYAWWGASGDVD